MKNSVGIYWLKRDFRLLDNPALTEALLNCEQVVPLYIAEPSMISAGETSYRHLYAIESAFNSLKSKVTEARGDIYYSVAEVIELFSRLYELHPFTHLFSHEEIGVDRTYQRDLKVNKWCQKNNVQWIEIRQTGVFRRLNNRDKRGRLWRQFYELDFLPEPNETQLKKLGIPKAWQDLLSKESLALKNRGKSVTEENISSLQPVSEADAHLTLESFLSERGIAYSGGISSPLTSFTAGSRMSVHLAWGTISGRYVYQKNAEKKEFYKSSDHPEAGKWRRSLTAFQARLHWRDHFIQRLETEPQMEFHALNEAYDAVVYDGGPELLQAWRNGTTGYPMVDACIRCLRETGFINFRMRAMITSFACHVLHLSWKDIDHPMAQLYTDYEPGIHLSQLQMQAGVVGINTIRVYSPTKQIVDHDPDCIFIKKWIPELRPFTPVDIIGHGFAPLGDYPAHIVDYLERSRAMKSQLYSIKGKSATKALAAAVYEKHGSRKTPLSKRRI